jgi:hypothetical protein
MHNAAIQRTVVVLPFFSLAKADMLMAIAVDAANITSINTSRLEAVIDCSAAQVAALEQ